MRRCSPGAAALAATLWIVACASPPGGGTKTAGDADSLFMGYWLGMPRDSFYVHSRALNRQGIVKQSSTNQHIQYQMDSTLAHEALMLFYPDFHEDRIVRMRMRFSYEAWAPWNKFLFADSLLGDVVALMTSWYGQGFEPRTVQGRYGTPTTEYVKEDEHRRIAIGVLDDIEVGVLISDREAARQWANGRDESN